MPKRESHATFWGVAAGALHLAHYIGPTMVILSTAVVESRRPGRRAGMRLDHQLQAR